MDEIKITDKEFVLSDFLKATRAMTEYYTIADIQEYINKEFSGKEFVLSSFLTSTRLMTEYYTVADIQEYLSNEIGSGDKVEC